jgi:hypothetical protein
LLSFVLNGFQKKLRGVYGSGEFLVFYYASSALLPSGTIIEQPICIRLQTPIGCWASGGID